MWFLGNSSVWSQLDVLEVNSSPHTAWRWCQTPQDDVSVPQPPPPPPPPLQRPILSSSSPSYLHLMSNLLTTGSSMASSSGLVITRASYTTQGNRSASLGKGMIKGNRWPDTHGGAWEGLEHDLSVPVELRWVSLHQYLCFAHLEALQTPYWYLWRLPCIDLMNSFFFHSPSPSGEWGQVWKSQAFIHDLVFWWAAHILKLWDPPRSPH